MSKFLNKINRNLTKLNPYGELIKDPKQFITTDYISLGNYVANLHMTGSLFRGFPNNTISMLAGESGCGKTFIAMNAAKQALDDGRSVFYFDTEKAINKEMLVNFGIYDYWDINPDREYENFISIIPISIVEDLVHQLSNTIDIFRESFLKGDYNPDTDKAMFVVDSLGNLSTRKEIEDSKSGKEKVDMTAAKMLKKVFRLITVPCGILKIPVILTNHVYASLDPFSGPQLKGGSGSIYAASNILAMSKFNHKEENKKTKSKDKVGIRINAQPFKNRFAIPKPFNMVIFFAKGMNKYYGLEQFFGPEGVLNYENIGIERGSMKDVIDDIPQFDENGDPILYKSGSKAGQQKTKKGVVDRIFEPNGNKSGAFYVKHLDRMVDFPSKEFYSDVVFTPEILNKINEIVMPLYELSKKTNNPIDISDMADEIADKYNDNE